MLGPYSQILSRPGAWQFSAAGLIARMPMSTLGLGLILMITALYDSYGLAGQVMGVFVGTSAVAAPQLARLVDRFGQARVMFPSLAIALAAAVGLVIAATNRWDTWVLFTLAVIMGATIGQLGPLVRARWKHILPGARDLHTAFSLESAIDEFIFIVGPVVATYLATTIHPAAGVFAAIVTLTIGGIWLLSQRATEPPPVTERNREHRGFLLRIPGLAATSAVLVGLGGVFGAYDVAVVAFATEADQRDMAGLILASMALGSLIGGLGYGARHWTSPIWRRFVIGCVALGLGVCVLLLVHSLWLLTAVAFIIGFAVAPTIINGSTIAQIVAPTSRLTEALAWIGTAIGVGVAAGSWIAGLRIDAAGSAGGMLVTVLAGLVVAGSGIAVAPIMRRDIQRAYAELAQQVTETGPLAGTNGPA